MSEISDSTPATEQGEELDDFDVEGHSLRGVAVGLSVSSVVASGAGAVAMAMDNPIPATTAGVHAVAAGAYSDAVRHADATQRTAHHALDRAGATVVDVQRTVDRTGAVVVTATDPVVDRVNAAVTEAGDLADRAVTDPLGTTDAAVDQAVQTGRELRDGALGTAKQTVSAAGTAAGQAAEAAGQTAVQTVDVATTTVDGAYQVVDPQVGVEMQDDGTTVTVGAAGKSVSVSAG